jgi:hypothetical protein
VRVVQTAGPTQVGVAVGVLVKQMLLTCVRMLRLATAAVTVSHTEQQVQGARHRLLGKPL